MSNLKAFQLLMNVAGSYNQQVEDFSKQEIVKKINEIKYLSSQKKVPKLTLRKEIIHLENKLQKVFEMDKKITAQKKRESTKIKSLKDEIIILKKKLAAVEDKDLQKKVDKLSYLLAEATAKKEVGVNVKLQNRIVSEAELNPKKASSVGKLKVLHYRLDAMKKNLMFLSVNSDPKKVAEIKKKIDLLELKFGVSKPGVRHTMLLKSPLDLPPPPKRRIN